MSTELQQPDPFRLLSDEDLKRMRENAWTAAVIAWDEARKAVDAELRSLLIASAQSAEAYWQRLRDEEERRRRG